MQSICLLAFGRPAYRSRDGVAGTVSQITDLVGRYRDAGVRLLISSTCKNDIETLELLASDVMTKFA